MMKFRIHQNRYSILIFIAILCTFSVVNAQDTKPIVKPKPTIAPKPVVVKPQPKPPVVETQPSTNWRNKYDYIETFSDGLAVVRKYSKYGFVDRAGNEVIPLIYDYAYFFVDGLAAVVKNGKTFTINKQGKCIHNCPK
jgi:hypothetical protein